MRAWQRWELKTLICVRWELKTLICVRCQRWNWAGTTYHPVPGALKGRKVFVLLLITLSFWINDTTKADTILSKMAPHKGKRELEGAMELGCSTWLEFPGFGFYPSWNHRSEDTLEKIDLRCLISHPCDSFYYSQVLRTFINAKFLSKWRKFEKKKCRNENGTGRVGFDFFNAF